MSRTIPKRELAQKAINKAAPFGKDINLEDYSRKAKEHPYEQDLSHLPRATKERMLEVGIISTGENRRGTFVQIDHSLVHCSTSQEGLEVLSSLEALKKYSWLEDYWWQAVPVDADKFTAQAEIHQNHGYFIRALPGVKAIHPIQACLYLSQSKITQNVHNIIIAEENSELHIVTGCTTAPSTASGLHIGVSEFYVKRGAKITFTMLHNWAPDFAVRPRTGVIIEENGTFISNYICLKPVGSLQMYPTAWCTGEDSVVRFQSILVAPSLSNMDVGARAILEAKGARAEIISRTITTGGNIIARGHLIGKVPEVKGHLECRGLILSGQGSIEAIPELSGLVPGVDLSHEAAVGKIAEEEVEYLMARGLTRTEATAAIVRGFLKVEIEGLPTQLTTQIQQAIESSERELF